MRLNPIGFPKLPDAWYWMEEIAEKHFRLKRFLMNKIYYRLLNSFLTTVVF